MSDELIKSRGLLEFLREFSKLRRHRPVTYGPNDKVIWFADLQNLSDEVISALLSPRRDEELTTWLEVQKPTPEDPPKVPEPVGRYFHISGWREPKQEPTTEPKSAGATLGGVNLPWNVLRDAKIAWKEYLEKAWRPWAEKQRRVEEVLRLYEELDYMRRRIEEAEERYELVLAAGLLIWRDPANQTVRRHLLTARAEIILDARRGRLRVVPDATVDAFRVELDMLGPQHQPRWKGSELEEALAELGMRAWDTVKLGEILRWLGNQLDPRCSVHAEEFGADGEADAVPRIHYAPALVLRERRLRAYEELVDKLLERMSEDAERLLTRPWLRIIYEGNSAVAEREANDRGQTEADGRLFYPLPTNEEQRSIAERLRAHDCVLVKGPPGTGKSHTIANLICHLLASGERVLVTAQAPKALEVLLGLLPRNIEALCVTLLGSGREHLLRLEESVRRILAEHDRWRGVAWAGQEAARLEQQLQRLEEEAAALDRKLREAREAETYTHRLPGGYEGTAAEIAQRVEQEAARFDWFPRTSFRQGEWPLDEAETRFLADFHARLTQERRQELSLDSGPDELPAPEEFQAAVNKLLDAEAEFQEASADVEAKQLGRLEHCNHEQLEALKSFLEGMDAEAARASSALREVAEQVLADCLAGRRTLWAAWLDQAREAFRSMQDAVERLGEARIELMPEEAMPARFRAEEVRARLFPDAQRRLEHLQGGGWRGWWILAPRVIRETAYIEQIFRIDGRAPRSPEDLRKVVAFYEFEHAYERFRQLWPAPMEAPRENRRLLVLQVRRAIEGVEGLVGVFAQPAAASLRLLPVAQQLELWREDHRARWIRCVHAELSRRRLEGARKQLADWRDRVSAALASGGVHACVHQLEEAIRDRDLGLYAAAWAVRERLRQEQPELVRYEGLLRRIESSCPELATLLRAKEGEAGWGERIRELKEAWVWAYARAWLARVTEPGYAEALAEQRREVQIRIEEKVGELASLKAWTAFFQRLDDRTRQNLIAWGQAMRRMGRGTGAYAWLHRRAAQRYLLECLPQIPAWIMPLYRVWEMSEAQPGIFDTVIVDEASQAGLESLLLLLLAKRIVVVGDDMQNSPEAVGIPENDIARLTRDHLWGFHFREEFRPDCSLYDQADRAFGQLITLREHFRCVPEIIRFSNELCYHEAPLIPLRQPPPQRLQPLKAVFVEGGWCRGEAGRIENPAEAEAIVDAIERCLADEAYEDKTMGVIVLQGHLQAERIERELARRIPASVRQERKLRCGVPATFQGDQRDVIFLSLVIAPNHSFRALTEIEAKRRFNVAMSRARDQVWLFHSVQLHDLSREDLRYRLLNFFNEPQVLRERHEDAARLEQEALRRGRQPGRQPEPYESWFEVDVALALLRLGYRLLPQYEVAGYRIDFVIEGEESRLALECDGDAWHGPERYEYDLQRQRQLERAGWRFVRLRASEFYADRSQAIQRIVEACEEQGIRPAVGPTLTSPAVFVTAKAADEGEGEVAAEDEPEEASADERLVEEEAGWGLPDPREAPAAAVREALRALIEQEGPMNKRRLVRLYVRSCPSLQRAGKLVRRALDRGLMQLRRAGEIEIENLTGVESPEFVEIRAAGASRVAVRERGSRDLLEIPPSELLEVLRGLAQRQGGEADPDEALMHAVLEHYGFDRLTKNRRAFLQVILRVFRSRGWAACAPRS